MQHYQHARCAVLLLEVLVGELFAVDRLAAGAVETREVAALQQLAELIGTAHLTHEVWDDPMKFAALVVQRLARLAHALLARAQTAEVLGRLRHDVAVQLQWA